MPQYIAKFNLANHLESLADDPRELLGKCLVIKCQSRFHEDRQRLGDLNANVCRIISCTHLLRCNSNWTQDVWDFVGL